MTPGRPSTDMPTCHHEQALQTGALTAQLAARSPHGRVCGVFSHGLACEFGGLAVTCSPHGGGVPLGITLASLSTVLDRSWIGRHVVLDDQELVVEDAGWAIDLRGAALWDSRQWLSAVTFDPRGLSARLAMVSSCFAGRDWAPGPAASGCSFLRYVSAATGMLGGTFLGRMLASIGKLQRGLRHGMRSQLAEGIQDLLGVGPGLTPSGDDCLVGLLLALQTGQSLWPELAQGILEVTDIIQSLAPHRTNLFGWSHLYAACLGQGAEAVVRALDWLFSRHPPAPPSAIEELTRIGGSSGIDTLLGICAGCTIGLGMDWVASAAQPGNVAARSLL